MFRGKESFKQDRIILISSRLIEFWCFRLPVALGVGVWGWGMVGGAPHTRAQTCARIAHLHVKHDNFNCKMAGPIGGIPGNSL